MTSAATRRAIVIGGSMSGLFAGLLLLRRGWQVAIYERAERELTSRGAGIVTHPELWRVLTAVGLDPTRDLGVDVVWRRTLDRDGRVIAELECRQTMTAWDRLYDMLRTAVPPRTCFLGKELARVDQRGDAVVAHVTDGSSADGDVLIGCDGIRSTVRAQVAPDVRPEYAGYVAWRGLVHESDLPAALHDEMFEAFLFFLPPAEQMLTYPVAGPENDLRRGHRRTNFVWYRPVAAGAPLQDLLTDAAGQTHAISIPPPSIRQAFIEELRAHAERVLPPQMREVIRLTAQPFLQPIYDLAAPRLAAGRVAVMGDAAFVARPHVGAGVAKAALDALALADALADTRPADVPAALARYDAPRRAAGDRVVRRARQLGDCLRTQFGNEAERRRGDAARRPDVMMRETATLDFLSA